MAKAFYRAFDIAEGKRGDKVTRLHIVREDGRRPGTGGYCPASLGIHKGSRAIILEPLPVTPPAGLKWCPTCVGQHAERAGQLHTFAAILAVGGYPK